MARAKPRQEPTTAPEPVTVAVGRATFMQNIEEGRSQADALTAALEAVRDAERAACIAMAESWVPLAERHGYLDGTWAARRIVDDLKGELGELPAAPKPRRRSARRASEGDHVIIGS